MLESSALEAAIYWSFVKSFLKYELIPALKNSGFIPFTTNLLSADYEPNILFSKEQTRLSKDSVAVIHLIGAANKFCFDEKISKLTEENYQKLVDAVIRLISNKKC